MKKVFTFVAVMLLAAVAANATVLWEETFDRNGTYITKVQGQYWPWADQWFTGYDDISGSSYSFDYTNVTSQGVSIRGKKLNGGENNTIGLYFSANKAEDKNYVQFDGEIVANPEEGMRLVFEICSTETNGGDLSTMVVKVNGNAVTVPATTLGAQYATSTISVELPNEAVNTLYFAFNTLPDKMQKFITHPRIEVGATAVENVTVAPQATKMIENGQVIIIRNGVRYNSVGTVIE